MMPFTETGTAEEDRLEGEGIESAMVPGSVLRAVSTRFGLYNNAVK